MNLFNKNEKNKTLHYGEIYHCWEHLNMAKSCMGKFSLLYNHTEDRDLKSLIEDMRTNLVNPEINKLEQVLLDNGIEIKNNTKERPKIKASSIPTGARFSDMEIASCIANDIKQAMASSNMVVSISTNEDLAMFFSKHYNELVKYGGKMLRLMKEKEWLAKPPLKTEKAEMV